MSPTPKELGHSSLWESIQNASSETQLRFLGQRLRGRYNQWVGSDRMGVGVLLDLCGPYQNLQTLHPLVIHPKKEIESALGLTQATSGVSVRALGNNDFNLEYLINMPLIRTGMNTGEEKVSVQWSTEVGDKTYPVFRKYGQIFLRDDGRLEINDTLGRSYPEAILFIPSRGGFFPVSDPTFSIGGSMGEKPLLTLKEVIKAFCRGAEIPLSHF